MTKRKILVTSAMLYANGPLHLGHMVEQVQTDIWARFQRLRGHHCLHVGGEDAHGTPIMLSAEKRGITPEALIAEMGAAHRVDIKDFLIDIDNFYTTHSTENQILAERIFNALQDAGHISTNMIEQAYDPKKSIFLPDRFVKGECPRCAAADQYGDNCEQCGATYSPAELKNPRSAISGATPVLKKSLHYFFQLPHYANMLSEWTHSGALQSQVTNKLQEWLKSGLQPWDISRDRPYFGFKIPGTEDKYFYVWLDAPVGYMASLQHLAARDKRIKFDDYWKADSDIELYHFIGKDIIYFHGLFWPAMLHGAGFRIPTAIFTHGFLTINGQKMSKSRGTFIKARTYLQHFDPEYLRYYFAARLGNGIDDIDLNFDDFMARVNADLVGKVVNIASRSAGFIHKYFDDMLADTLAAPALFATLTQAANSIACCYEKREYSRAMREIMECADKVNRYIDAEKPWIAAKDPARRAHVQAVCTMSLNCFRLLMIYLKPVLPTMAAKSEAFLNISPLCWEDHQTPLLNHHINPFSPLLKRIESAQIEALILAAKQEAATTAEMSI